MDTEVDEFVCGCGRDFTTKSGLTNHQKRCGEHSDNGEEKPKTSTPINTTEKNAIQKLILRRQDTMLKAMETELNGNVDVIKDQLLRDKGVTLSSAQLTDLVKSVQQQIDAEVDQHTKLEQERVEVEIAELEEEYEEKEREMKERHRREWKDLGDEKRDKKIKLKARLKSSEDRVTKERAGHLVAKKLDLQKQLAIAKQIEAEVASESQQRLLIITQSKGRLEHVVNDAANRALETLWTARTREDVEGLIDRIPTVSEALTLCSSAEGIHDLFRRLDPTMAALPAPIKNVEPAEVEEEEEDEKDEEDEEEREWEHDSAVYDDD